MPTPEEIEAAFTRYSLPFRPCGLNADWIFQAYHLGPSSEPNRVSGDLYVFHDEDADDDSASFQLFRRTYSADFDETRDEELTDGGSTLDHCLAIAREILA